jgi:c-di-AMP phosphodiesterase-like protein
MTKAQSSDSKVVLGFSKFFEKALEVIRPPFMKLIVVFVVVLLLALFLLKRDIDPTLGFALVAVVVLILASLAAALHYAEMKLRYLRRTEEQLKSALRQVVTELQITRMEDDTSGDKDK